MSTNPVDAMDPELKAKWLEALRSGRYAQTREYLRQDGGFCCLGVLCDIANPEAWTEGEGWLYENEEIREVDTCELPVPFRRNIGISDIREQQLIELNDEAKASFEQIADWIEANL
jgi:hypothetical protein